MKWWKHVLAMEFRKILAYRSDFWITFLGQTLIQLLVARSLWQMIFATNGVQEMQGYTIESMGLYYLIAPIGSRILWGENIGFLSREIYDGTFTRYLLYPLSFFQYKTVTYLSYSLFYSIQLFILFLLYRLFFTEMPYSFSEIIHLSQGIALFLLASVTFLLMSFAVEMISLWADNIWTLMIMLRFFTSFFGGGFLPLEFLPSWAQTILSWTPFPYLISFPIKTIMGRTLSQEMWTASLILSVWILVFTVVIHWIWSKGEKKYSGVGI